MVKKIHEMFIIKLIGNNDWVLFILITVIKSSPLTLSSCTIEWGVVHHLSSRLRPLRSRIRGFVLVYDFFFFLSYSSEVIET